MQGQEDLEQLLLVLLLYHSLEHQGSNRPTFTGLLQLLRDQSCSGMLTVESCLCKLQEQLQTHSHLWHSTLQAQLTGVGLLIQLLQSFRTEGAALQLVRKSKRRSSYLPLGSISCSFIWVGALYCIHENHSQCFQFLIELSAMNIIIVANSREIFRFNMAALLFCCGIQRPYPLHAMTVDSIQVIAKALRIDILLIMVLPCCLCFNMN